MAEKILNTRIQLKYDTYEKWVENNPTLKKGEVAIATIENNKDGVQNAPSVLIKVGDGTSDYKTLKFVSGLAADVYGWAKAENKPTYEAKEITGIDSYIAEYVNDQMGISVDTDTQYQVVKVDDYNYKLQSKGKTDEAWADVEGGTIVIPKYDDTSISNRVGAIEADYLKNKDKAEIMAKVDEAKGAANTAQETANGAVGAVEALGEYVGTFTPVGEETTVVGYIDAKIGAIPEQTDYSVTVTESSPEGYAKTYTFKQLGADIATINIPKDMVVESGSVVTNPEGQAEGTYIKLVLANATEDELFINVGDLIEYVTGDTAADGMVTVNVDADHVATATINDGTVTLAKLHIDVQTAIGKAHEHANKNLLDTYTQTEANLADAVAKKHEHENKTVLDGITAEKVADWDDAVAKEHEHENKTVLDGITAEKVAAWDAAQANVLENVAGVDGSIADKTFTVTGVSTDLLTQGTDTIVFDCGTSAI